jgi:hypothetical protein
MSGPTWEAAPTPTRVVPAYAWAFHEMFRHSDLFQLGAFTFATAMMSQTRTDATLNPTGLLFKMYRDHFGTIPVEVSGNSPQPKPVFPAGGDQPAVNPGSDTYPLDVSRCLERRSQDAHHRRPQPVRLRTQHQLKINGTKARRCRQAVAHGSGFKIDATVQVGQDARGAGGGADRSGRCPKRLPCAPSA